MSYVVQQQNTSCGSGYLPQRGFGSIPHLSHSNHIQESLKVENFSKYES
jgi:hypothetical protein